MKVGEQMVSINPVSMSYPSFGSKTKRTSKTNASYPSAPAKNIKHTTYHSRVQLNDTIDKQRKQIRDLQSKNKLYRKVTGLLATVLATGGVGVAAHNYTDSHQFDASGHTIEETADFLGVNAQVLKLANNMNIEKTPNDKILEGKIKVPKQTSIMEESIKKYAEKMNKSTNPEDKEENNKKLLEAINKEHKLNELYEFYEAPCDSNVYILALEPNITYEELKSDLGINDGVILSCNNNIPFSWEKDERGKYYMDHTDACISQGTVTIVPKQAINQDK